MFFISAIFKEFWIASKLPPPTFSFSTKLLFFDWDDIKIANNIAKNKNKADERLNSSNPYSLNEFENLLEISEPNNAPNEPPAIITP